MQALKYTELILNFDEMKHYIDSHILCDYSQGYLHHHNYLWRSLKTAHTKAVIQNILI